MTDKDDAGSGGLFRRDLLIHGLVAAGTVALPLRIGLAQQPPGQEPPPPPPKFDFDALSGKAQALARKPYQNGKVDLPAAFRNLTYDQYRDIRFTVDQALWKGKARFEVQCFHLGFLYDQPVTLNLLADGVATPVAYRRDMFNYGPQVKVDQEPPADLGFAGFRLHYPLHKPGQMDEVIAFLGASYFRMVGRNQVYGLSARGLAINTASSRGEEFPRFREFWIEQPPADGDVLTLYALLDSPSCTGAYRFVISPGTETVTEVQCTIHPRADIEKLGVAPLTSMFFYGENRTRPFDDFRPEVHDSDGLQIFVGNGDWLWRPLVNPRDLRVSSFALENPRGFGLAQRDRDFDHYQDLESRYHRRPSHWIEPIGDWGKGRVELVEIPSEEEINDNIAAYWVPEAKVQAGNSVSFRYKVFSYLDIAWLPPGGRVAATRIGTARTPGNTAADRNARHFVLDFEGGELPHLAAEEILEAVVSASSGKVHTPVVMKNVETGGWRVFFDMEPDGKRASDLRCHLRLRGRAVTETWTYLWTPV